MTKHSPGTPPTSRLAPDHHGLNHLTGHALTGSVFSQYTLSASALLGGTKRIRQPNIFGQRSLPSELLSSGTCELPGACIMI